MSITADPLFIAAEMQWRYDRHPSGPALELPLPEEHRHHSWRRAVSDRIHHRHQRHQGATRPSTPRVA